MPLPLQTPRPSEELTREFGIKGGMKLLLDEVITPVRILKDRPRKYAMGIGNVAAGGAGFRTEIVIVNPFTPSPGDDGNVHIHKIWFNASSGTIFEIAIPTAALLGLTSILSERFLDIALSGSPGAIFAQDNTAAATAATSVLRYVTPVDETKMIELDPPFIVPPGSVAPGFVFRPTGDNLPLQATFLWSEPPDPV